MNPKESILLPVLDKQPRAVAIDLDGTLLNSRLQVSDRNRKTLERCLDVLPVIIATARTERAVRRLIGESLTGSCSLVMLNGSVARAAPPLEGKLRSTISPEIASSIVEYTQSIERNVRITAEIEGFEFGCNERVDAAALWELNSATPEMVLPLGEAIARVPSKITISGKGKDLSALISGLAEHFGKAVSIFPTGDKTFINIVDPSTSKSRTLRYLLRSRDIGLEDTLALGDDVPDIDMLLACGVSIAMGNAFPDVKAICKYTTAGNDDDGVAAALELLVLQGK